ncbi:TetR/AcrR family transcriptional regulator [Saccharopolyspora rhizosphaerae]|uniref:TetR/AcrR family transcriptional regulator n=1 Tax=Saccharopolyspora rhizosphaerae TaxID=2492662 RepID=UPI001F1D7ACF|nr:TetR family transcriptional regulator [Saccharopolyspora rhizosphaerae]
MAEEEVAARGADASLEQIARTAGVGSATVRRHFPSRHAVLDAVSRKRVDALRVRADELATERGGREALVQWLSEVVDYCASARGLAVALAYDQTGAEAAHNSCSELLEEAANPLLRRAVRDNAVATSTTAADLIAAAVGVALATEHHGDPAAAAQRLFRLIRAGVSPQR